MRERDFVAQQNKAMGDSPHRNPNEHGGDSSPGESNFTPLASTYELENGIPYIASKFGLEKDMSVDSKVDVKTREVDKFIHHIIKERGMRDSLRSYEQVIDELLGGGGKQSEMAVRGGEGMKFLNLLFYHVSVNNKMSSESYLRQAIKNNREESRAKVVSQLRSLLRQLKA